MRIRKNERAIVDLRKLKPSPPYGNLTNGQMRRIVQVQKDCQEFYDRDLDCWIHDFLANCHVEREIRLWEGIADAYQRLIERYQLSPSRRRNLGSMLIAMSMGAKFNLDFIPRRPVENAFGEAQERALLGDSEDEWVVADNLIGLDALKSASRRLIFEDESVAASYLELTKRCPEWVWENKEPSEDGYFLCIAVHEPFEYDGTEEHINGLKSGYPEFIAL